MKNKTEKDIELQLLDKLDELESISAKTDISIIDPIVESIETSGLDSKINIELVNLKEMINDYKKVREALLENVESTQNVIKSFTADLYSDEEVSPDKISAYSSLIAAINTSVKILTASYKDISAVLLNLKKLESEVSKNSNENSNSNVNIENVNIISTVDIIKQLKDRSGSDKK